MKNQRTSLREYRGARLVEKRLAAGLTREQLAAKARVSTLTLKNWERGRTKPQPDKVRAVREVLAEAVPTPDIDRDALSLDLIVDRQALEVYVPLLWARVQKLHEDISLMHAELALVYHRINPNAPKAQADD